jgi:hypothetical protein
MTSMGSGTHRPIRLEPLGEQHAAGLDALVLDPDVQRNIYVPELGYIVAPAGAAKAADTAPR